MTRKGRINSQEKPCSVGELATRLPGGWWGSFVPAAVSEAPLEALEGGETAGPALQLHKSTRNWHLREITHISESNKRDQETAT